MNKKMKEELHIAKELILMAGDRILSVYHSGFSVTIKGDETPVTRADLEANEIIVAGLKKAFPAHSILSEESVDDLTRLTASWCWIVDPLDGTKEFVKKNDEFTVNIALAFEGRVVLGVVYAPVFGELYYAIEGQGAFMEQKGEVQTIHVSDRMDRLHVLKSRSHNASRYNEVIERHVDKISKITRMGSSIKGCRIASGEYDIYYNFGKTMLWDTAAMELIVKEAGGYFAQLDGTPINYRSEDPMNKKGFYILNCAENSFL